MKKWYAVQTEKYDAWDNGSHDLKEAVRMAIEEEEPARIIIINEETNYCEYESPMLTPEEWSEFDGDSLEDYNF